MKALPGDDEDEGGDEDENDGFLRRTFFFSLLLCFFVMSSLFFWSPVFCSFLFFWSPSSSDLLAFYWVSCCLSSQDYDKAWGHCVSVRLRHRQSRPCWTLFYKHEGVKNLSLSPRSCDLYKDKLCKLSSGWTGMSVFQHFCSFCAGELSASEEEEEKQRMLETVRFGLEMTISQFGPPSFNTLIGLLDKISAPFTKWSLDLNYL